MTICLQCLGDPEHIKTHEDYGRPWIPEPEELTGGCPCEPNGLDGLTCPRPDGTLLCEEDEAIQRQFLQTLQEKGVPMSH